MNVRVALCQVPSAPGNVEANVRSVGDILESEEADMFVFPELFLTGYIGEGCRDLSAEAERGRGMLLDLTRGNGVCVVAGCPAYEGGKVYNAALAVSDSVTEYRKLNLPSFGVFSEKDTFSPGSRPESFVFRGMRFGLTVCYDLFFPELYRHYARSGADASICISAAPESSRPFFDRVLPARSVENTAYTIFVNNIGTAAGLKMAGCSRCISPQGEDIVRAGDGSCVLTAGIGMREAEAARTDRPTVADVRNDIEWS